MLTRKKLTGQKIISMGLLLIGMATLGFTSTAQAQTLAKTYEVSFSQAELESTTGAEQVYARIQGAAFEVCKDEFGGDRFVVKRREMKKCVVEVVQELVNKANHKNLKKIANGKTVRFKQFASK